MLIANAIYKDRSRQLPQDNLPSGNFNTFRQVMAVAHRAYLGLFSMAGEGINFAIFLGH